MHSVSIIKNKNIVKETDRRIKWRKRKYLNVLWFDWPSRSMREEREVDPLSFDRDWYYYWPYGDWSWAEPPPWDDCYHLTNGLRLEECFTCSGIGTVAVNEPRIHWAPDWMFATQMNISCTKDCPECHGSGARLRLTPCNKS